MQVRRVGVPPAECPPRATGGGETLLLGPASERPTYVVEKQSSRLTSTRWALWRWGNFCHRTWAHTCNAMFLLGVSAEGGGTFASDYASFHRNLAIGEGYNPGEPIGVRAGA